MEAGKRTLGAIFDRASKLEVPHFQRAYVWKEDQWSRYLDDMKYATKRGRNYFMGAVILKQQETSMGEEHVRTVVDGQQRITTTMLFFKALYEKQNNPDRFRDVFTTYRGDAILRHNFVDEPVFSKVLHNKELSESDKKSRIHQCYKYFLDNIEPETIDANNLFSGLMFVGIDLQSGEDEQQIFDTINSLGVRLTTAELLKNFLFNRNVEAYQEHWQSVFESDDETREYWDLGVTAGRQIRTNIDVFLQSFLSIKIQDPNIKVSSDDRERFYKIESTFNSFKEFITNYEIDKSQLIAELKEYAEIYRSIINPNATSERISKGDQLGRLNVIIFGLETATIIPYLLYVSKKQADAEERNALFKYLEAYLMRRMITKSTTQNYNQVFRRLIGAKIKSVHELQEYIEKIGDKLDGMPVDEEVAKGIKESQLVNKQARGVLFLLESDIRSNLHSTHLKDFDDYSLEHVMPKKWRNNWNADGLSPEDELRRDKILLTLGNLTLLTSNLNSSVRDSDWDTKRMGRKSGLGLNEYAQGLETFSKYLDFDTWDEEVITQRALMLTKHALQVWNVPEEYQNRFTPKEEEYTVDPDRALFCKGVASNAEGRAGIGNRLVVKAGSLAAGEIQPSFRTHNYNNERNILLEEGVLQAKGNQLEFTKDYEFSSPSAAAAIVLGRSADGPNEWKNGDSVTLKQLRDASALET